MWGENRSGYKTPKARAMCSEVRRNGCVTRVVLGGGGACGEKIEVAKRLPSWVSQRREGLLHKPDRLRAPMWGGNRSGYTTHAFSGSPKMGRNGCITLALPWGTQHEERMVVAT